MGYSYVYSLNTDDYDDEYMQRTGVGVAADYGMDTADGSVVVYELTALADDGNRDAGWTAEEFVRYWNERGTVWQEEVAGCGDAAGTGDIVRTWMGKRGLGCTVCYIVLKAG